MTSHLPEIAHDVLVGDDIKIFELVSHCGCEIRDNIEMGAFVAVQSEVKIGKSCKIQSQTLIYHGATIRDEVKIAHGVTFINEFDPTVTNDAREIKGHDEWECVEARICRRASIGSNATILGAITTGKGTLVGAWAAVTRDVLENTVAASNPARVIRKRT